MPDRFGVPVVTCLRAFFHCTQGCGCDRAPHSLRPLFSGVTDDASLGHFVPRECGRLCPLCCLTVESEDTSNSLSSRTSEARSGTHNHRPGLWRRTTPIMATERFR